MRVEGQGKAVSFIPAQYESGRAAINAANKENFEEHAKVEKQYAGKPDLQELREAVDTVNNAIKISSYHLEFQLHEESERYQVKVIDNSSGEVIREIPPDYMLKFSARVREMLNNALGIIVDELV